VGKPVGIPFYVNPVDMRIAAGLLRGLGITIACCNQGRFYIGAGGTSPPQYFGSNSKNTHF